MVVVSIPWQDWIDDIGPVPDGVRIVRWDMEGPPPSLDITVVVPQYLGDSSRLARLAELPRLSLVQTLTAGYDDVLPHLPEGARIANAAGVHDASTAELGVGLMIAALRGFGAHLRHQLQGRWMPAFGTSLADRRILLIGYGSVGGALARRLAPFDVHVTPVARRARDGVRSIDEVPALLPDHDVVVLLVPLSESTHHLVDRDFLARMPDGALLVNLARGPVVDTEALVAELSTGRLSAALDVVEPEPLPAGHPLWALENVILTPHVGGASTAFRPRAIALLREQLERLAAGAEPLHVVVPPPA